VKEQVSSAFDVEVIAPDDLSTLPGLSVTADPGQHACRLRLCGTLDDGTVPLFTACLTSWVDRGMSHLVIDLTEVRAVDRSGAAVLARAAHALARAGGSVHVVATPELARGPLGASGLDVIAPTNETPTVMIGVRHDG
jgi:anti-anti-sigma factor